MYNNYFSNFGRPLVPDDLCKDSAPRHPRFWKRRFLQIFTTYGHGGHLGQRTATILAILRSPKGGSIWNLNKTGSAASEEKSFENVNRRTDARTDDGRNVITIAHPEHTTVSRRRFFSFCFFFRSACDGNAVCVFRGSCQTPPDLTCNNFYNSFSCHYQPYNNLTKKILCKR